MSDVPRPFAGRVIFHHLPKTAGQAINQWLRTHLGEGSVTPNLDGDHKALIREYGGAFSVISGHLKYDGSGLDPRYKYCTVLRHPRDRFISWLYFIDRHVSNNSETAELRAGARLFIETNGRESTQAFLDSVKNPYVENLRSAVFLCDADPSHRLKTAIDVLSAYDCVEFIENQDHLLKAFASVFGIRHYSKLQFINVTEKRGAKYKLNKEIKNIISDYIELDVELYEHFKAKISTLRPRKAFSDKYERNVSMLGIRNFCARLAWAASTFDIYYASSFSFEVGISERGVLISDGNPGYLLFGDLSFSEAGEYEIGLLGRFESYGSLCTFELLCGENIVGEKYILDRAKDANREFYASLKLKVEKQQKVGIRVFVPATHKIRIDSIIVARLHALSQREEAIERQIEKIASHNAFLLLGPLSSSDIGARVASSFITRGISGYLVYGNYTPLKIGVYQITVFGEVGPRGLSGAFVDVVCDLGGTLIHREPLLSTVFNVGFGVLETKFVVRIVEETADCEVRIFVNELSQFCLYQVAIIEEVNDGG